MTTVLTITPPCAFLNANDRLHWRKKAELTRAWRDAANDAALLDTDPREYPFAQVTCAIRFPDNRRRDVGNWYPTAKACLDGIVAAGRHLTDDSDEFIVGPDLRRHIPNGDPLVTITIKELP